MATIAYHYDGSQWQKISQSAVGRHLRNLTRFSFYNQNPQVSIVAHGLTHQSRYSANPYNGVSGDDFEFYRVLLNRDNSLDFESPIPGERRRWGQGT